MKVSVIIPTKGRAAPLGRLLGTISQQTCPPVEVIIVDQTPAPAQVSEVRPALGACGDRLVYIHDPAVSGVAQARNRGMALAAGDIWLFLDDDVALEPDFIEAILRAYQEHPDASGISGVITNYRAPGLGFRLYHRIAELGPFWDDRQPVYWKAERLGQAVSVSRFSGGVMSVRRTPVRCDENLTGISPSEDVDFSLQVARTGTLFIEPRARAFHHQVAGSRGHWLGGASQAAWYLYFKHWRRSPGATLAFAWLNVAYLTGALAGSVRRQSFAPLRAFLQGAKAGYELGSRG